MPPVASKAPRFPDPENYVPPPCRVIAANGVWQVPPSQRPPGWRGMGLKEKPAKAAHAAALAAGVDVGLVGNPGLAQVSAKLNDAARRFVSGADKGMATCPIPSA